MIVNDSDTRGRLIPRVARRLALVLAGIAAAVLLLAVAEGTCRLLDVGAERGLFTAEVTSDGT